MKRFRAALLIMVMAFVAVVTPSAPAQATTTQSFVPTTVTVGYQHACALDTSGAAYCWGANGRGQLGDNTTNASLTPVAVAGGLTFTAIQAADTSTCGLLSGGAAYCWGENTDGQLGTGDWSDHHTPTVVTGSHSFASLSASGIMACGVTAGGAGYCWGNDYYGQLGDGTNTTNNAPQLVAGSHTFSNIAAGGDHACGATTAHVLYCWGVDNFGQLGDGGSTNQNSPTLASGGLSVLSTAIGQNHSCAITTTNDAYCWGVNWSGQLGDGSASPSSTPVAVTGGAKFARLSAMQNSTCGVTTSGVGYCWGEGTQSELGTGSSTTISGPSTPVTGSHTFSIVATEANALFACGVSGVTIYCWGQNSEGEFGNNSTTVSNSPVQTWTVYATSTSTVSAIVDPSFTFSIAGRASTCNGESNWVNTGGASTAVNLGHITGTAVVSAGQNLTVSGNSGNGFSVYLRGTQATQNLRSTLHNWIDVSGTYASPATWGAGEQFGYSYADSTASSSVSNPSLANFAKLDSATTNKIMGSTSSLSGNGCVSFQVGNAATTQAGSYSATILYTAVPTF